MSDTIQAWPVARQGTTRAIRHPAWEAARNAVLDLAAEGPVTVLLVGDAGTGKSWLLRELAGSFGDHGFPSTLLMQGDLPISLSDGAALLVDEALRMPDPVLDELLAQRRGVVVLTDMERLAHRVANRTPAPVVIPLRPIEPDEVDGFIAEWLRRAALPPDILEPGALARLALHGRGSVRLLAKLLGAAVAMRKAAGKTTISAADFDQMVDFRLRGLELPPEASPAATPAAKQVAEPVAAPVPETPAPPLDEAPPPAPIPEPEPAPAPIAQAAEQPRRSAPPARRRPRNVLLAGTALAVAACLTLAWGLRRAPTGPAASTPTLPALRQAELASPATAQLPPPPSGLATPAPERSPSPQTELAASALPPLRPAELATPAMAAVAPLPVPAAQSAPALTNLLPPPGLAPAVQLATLPTPSPRLAGEAEPPAAAASSTPGPVLAAAPAFTPPPSVGAPGMVLIAQRGVTLQSMYNAVYRDRPAPPFADVLAANPQPFHPGALVVFPAPPGGWTAPP